MSKINNIPDQIPAIRQKVASVNTSAGGDAFSKTLKEVISASAQPVENVAALSPTSGIAAPVFLNTFSTAASEAVDRADTLISRLDEYAQKLGDPSSTLREIEPLIDSIKKEADDLNSDLDKKLPDSSGLKKLVKEFTIAANAEFIRFKRGDYA